MSGTATQRAVAAGHALTRRRLEGLQKQNLELEYRFLD